MTQRHVAILGAGATGCCAALEVAARGHRVTLYERQEQPVREASYANEGKIHLGYIYAKDTSHRTARTMIDGSLVFESYLQRWLDYRAEDSLSTPFYYGIHRGSLQNVDQLLAHYQLCTDYCNERSRALGLNYLGQGGTYHRRVAERNFPKDINPEYIPHLIETGEYAVDPRVVAEKLRAAIEEHPRIDFRSDHEVLAVEARRQGDFRIELKHAGAVTDEWFKQVVNTTWYRRLPLDRPLGITPPAKWSHRYKFANRITIPLAAADLPSLTCVQGPFGDLVNFGDRGFFLSWYPTGRTGMSTEETPPEWDRDYSDEQRREVFQRSYDAWALRCPALDKLDFGRSDIDPVGGVIYALGTTDVDEQSSKLHDRFEIGIQSQGHYHSVDTGKYTLAPHWGVAIADRVEGLA
ncbi:FAD-dependent oxidoreductase [Candidatus Marimicrobium litorale]|uniref:FAD-binding oxidoreductase n=1 Tax=Candidatus Marimicrobium litorale TaxID=2518991 RepID=A0ABT3T9E6_9GAMM|nr:FAD-dependent oxidoreductase [Candidatus Marimicrobium litorale]MCX2978912.1 FAD-binding oxidoreductase [Candidatus Marimicrobium litorale]